MQTKKPAYYRGLAVSKTLRMIISRGGRCPGTNELAQPTVSLGYRERWAKNKIDLLGLETLRDSGLTMLELAVHFGICKSTLFRRLRLSALAKGGPRGSVLGKSGDNRDVRSCRDGR